MNSLTVFAALMVAIGSLTGSVRAQRSARSAEDLGGYYDYKTWETRVDGDKFKTKYRVRLTILNSRGVSEGNLSLQADKYHRIDNLKIRVLDSDDKEVYSRKQKDMNKACGFGPSFALYNDVCNYYIGLPGPGFPYHIEYEYEVEVSPLFFLDGAYFQEGLPVRSAIYELTWPADRELHYQTLNLDVTPTVVDEGKRVVYRWEVSDLPAVSGESRLTPRDRTPGKLAFSPDAFEFEGFTFDDWSWNGVGKWYNAVAADRYLPAADIERPAPADPLAVMKAAYERVVDNNRYVSVAIGIGGWQPHAAASVQEKAYGDCKDLTTLLISYLREAGVTAHPVLVLTKTEGVVDRDFPTFGFNHVITAATTGTDTIWMDPTCSTCPFGELPPPDEDIDVLMMNDQGGTLVRTPGSTADENRLLRETHIRLQPDKTYRAESVFRLAGNMALSYRGVFDYGNTEDQRNFVLRLLPDNGAGARLIDYGFDADTTGDCDAILLVHFETTRPLDNLSGTWYLTPDIFGGSVGLKSVDLKERVVPIDLGYPRTITDDILITWHGCPAFDDVIGPPDDSADCDLLSCSRTSVMYADSVRIRLERRTGAYELPVEKFEALADIRKVSDRIQTGMIKFHEAAVKAGK